MPFYMGLLPPAEVVRHPYSHTKKFPIVEALRLYFGNLTMGCFFHTHIGKPLFQWFVTFALLCYHAVLLFSTEVSIMTTTTVSIQEATKFYNFYKHTLVKIDGKWFEAYFTKEDYSYFNVDIELPQPTLVAVMGGKKLLYIKPVQLGWGAFKFYGSEDPKEVLSFANGNVIEIREKRTQSASGDVGSITIYWFAFNQFTGELLALHTGSCWRSDGNRYPNMINQLKEDYSALV